MSTRGRQFAHTVLVLGVLGLLCYWQFAPRAERFGLAMVVDGPAPSHAAGLVVFLHGLGRGQAQGEDVAKRLRSAGLPRDVSIVIVRAPYRFGLLGFSWGAGRNIGRAIATGWAHEVACAVVNTRAGLDEGRGVEAEITGAGGEAILIAADLTPRAPGRCGDRRYARAPWRTRRLRQQSRRAR